MFSGIYGQRLFEGIVTLGCFHIFFSMMRVGKICLRGIIGIGN